MLVDEGSLDVAFASGPVTVNGQALFDLQDAMFGAKVHSVLVVLQGRDGAGKDGSIKHVVGCRVDSQIQNEKYKETLSERFDYAVLPMNWKQLQPQEGMFFTDEVDEWVEFLSYIAGSQCGPGSRGAAAGWTARVAASIAYW